MMDAEFIITVRKENDEAIFFFDKFMEKERQALVADPITFHTVELYEQDTEEDIALRLPIEQAKKMAREILALEGE